MKVIVSLRLRLETAGYQEPSLLKQAEGPFWGNAGNLSIHCRAETIHDFLKSLGRRPLWEGLA